MYDLLMINNKLTSKAFIEEYPPADAQTAYKVKKEEERNRKNE